jgi:hypothetical protein
MVEIDLTSTGQVKNLKSKVRVKLDLSPPTPTNGMWSFKSYVKFSGILPYPLPPLRVTFFFFYH